MSCLLDMEEVPIQTPLNSRITPFCLPYLRAVPLEQTSVNKKGLPLPFQYISDLIMPPTGAHRQASTQSSIVSSSWPLDLWTTSLKLNSLRWTGSQRSSPMALPSLSMVKLPGGLHRFHPDSGSSLVKKGTPSSVQLCEALSVQLATEEAIKRDCS